MPQFIAESPIRLPGTRVVCTQPRKIAALSLAKRVAEEMGPKGRELVSSCVGSDRQRGDETILEYVTASVLLKWIVQDENLPGISVVVLDEAHERQIDTDILLAKLRELARKRADFRLVVTSATIDPDLFAVAIFFLSPCLQLQPFHS